ncbi:hypothetical protein HPF17_1186, partial [Helicobacter pylori]
KKEFKRKTSKKKKEKP